jgi:HEAT repeat protein
VWSPDLRAQLAQSSGDNKVRLACAILPDKALSKNLIDMLEDVSLHWRVRINAAVGLRDFQDEMSERALLKAVEHDGNYLVRYNASDSLV